MADRRAQIEARLAAATPGTWTARGSQVSGPDGTLVAAVREHTETEHRPDADLIAHAPDDLRWLLDALAEAEAERERWKEVADAADDVIRAVLAALYRGPDTDAVIRAKKVMAERDALAARLAAVEGLAETWDREGITCPCGHDIGGEHNSNGCYGRVSYDPLVVCDCTLDDDRSEVDIVVAGLRDALDGDA